MRSILAKIIGLLLAFNLALWAFFLATDDFITNEVKQIKKIPADSKSVVTCRISPDQFSVLTLLDIEFMLADCKANGKDVFELAYCKDILNSGIMMERYLFLRNNFCGLQYPIYEDLVNVNAEGKCSYVVHTCHLDIK